MTHTITTEFLLRDQVYIDGCRNLVGVVTAVQWRHPEVINYEVSWVDNGKSEAHLIEEWRLSRVGD